MKEAKNDYVERFEDSDDANDSHSVTEYLILYHTLNYFQI